MRIDKFLKVSRILKRRTVAQEACGEDKVLINGKNGKALRSRQNRRRRGSSVRLGKP